MHAEGYLNKTFKAEDAQWIISYNQLQFSLFRKVNFSIRKTALTMVSNFA